MSLLAPEGEIVKEYRGDLKKLWLRTLVLGGLGGFWAIEGFKQLRMDGPATLICGVFALALLAESYLLRATARVVVRTDGLERWGVRGKLWSLRWPDAVDLYFTVERIRVEHIIPVGHRVTLRLVDAETKRRRLPNGMRDEADFVRHIVFEHGRAQLPGLRARLAAGEEVSFGTLALSTNEIRTLGLISSRCPLTELTEAALVNSRLVLKRRDKLLAFAKPSLIRTKNVFLLIALLEDVPGFHADRDLGLKA
jgi:hypothetical protein